MYVVSYGDARSNPFRIGADVYPRHVWQPTVDYFLPIQMCHVRVNERYRVWHDACHLDDARMAPVDHNHFDGYLQGPSTLTRYEPGRAGPGPRPRRLARRRRRRPARRVAGGHDARPRAGLGGVPPRLRRHHASTRSCRVVEMHQPDGKPDVLQQIEHGALTVVGGYRALGRFYRGIISPTLRQYTHLGDFAAQTDNVVFDPKTAPPRRAAGRHRRHGLARRPLGVHRAEPAPRARAPPPASPPPPAPCAATTTPSPPSASRVAKEIWDATDEDAVPAPPWAKDRPSARIGLAVELLITTGTGATPTTSSASRTRSSKGIESTGWVVGRALPLVGDAGVHERGHRGGEGATAPRCCALEKKTPYGVPYEPDIWGAGWGIQGFGMEQYFLHTAFPEIFPKDAMLHALNFVLGVHPGPNNASFVSGVGSRSVLVGYGLNRADWSYIPGGSVSGTALIRPGLPRAARVAVPLAADRVRPGRRHHGLPVPGAGRRPPAQPELTGTPLPVREILRVAEHGESCGVPASWSSANAQGTPANQPRPAEPEGAECPQPKNGRARGARKRPDPPMMTQAAPWARAGVEDRRRVRLDRFGGRAGSPTHGLRRLRATPGTAGKPSHDRAIPHLSASRSPSGLP